MLVIINLFICNLGFAIECWKTKEVTRTTRNDRVELHQRVTTWNILLSIGRTGKMKQRHIKVRKIENLR